MPDPSPRPRGRPPYRDALTPGEWRIVEAVRHGLSNRSIAEARGISRDAVKFHIANALAKLGLERRADLRRWSGIARDTALFNREIDMDATLEIGRITQISRVTVDIATATAWYRDVLGLPLLYSFDKMAFFDCGGTRLYLSEAEAAPAGESILYFAVPDIRTAYATLEARGARFISAPHLIHRHPDGTEEWMAMLEDPDGRPLAISSQHKA